MADTDNELPAGVEVIEPTPDPVETPAAEPKAEAQAAEPQTEENPVEAEARALGWQPKDEFDANPANKGKKWRSAELFMELTPLFEKIDTLHKTNKRLDAGLKALADHNRKIEVAAYNRAKAELKAARNAALEEQDFVKAEQIRDQMDAMTPPQPVVTAPAVQEPAPEFVEWRSRNRWYDVDEDARLFADTYGVKLHQSGKQPHEVLALVEAKVKKTFPNLFQNPNRANAPAVESGSRQKSSSSFQMTREEVDAMNTMLRAGAPITREEYIAQLKKARGA